MRADRPIRRFSDLPSSPGRHPLALRIGGGRHARRLTVWWQRGLSLHPCLVVTSMVHGDEFEGFAATRLLWKKLRGMKLRGSALIIPICNPWASETSTRNTPSALDGKNLARSFPGSERGSITQKLARKIWNLVKGADALVDLHSGGAGYDYAPLAGFYRKQDVPLAACFSLPFLWKVPINRGVLSYEFSKLGKPAIGCEYAGEQRLDPNGACAYLAGILALMKKLGTLNYTVSVRRQKMIRLDATRIQNASGTGWFFPSVQAGHRVRKGSIIGTWVTENFQSHEIKSLFDGVIIGLRTLPRVSRGEALMLVEQ